MYENAANATSDAFHDDDLMRISKRLDTAPEAVFVLETERGFGPSAYLSALAKDFRRRGDRRTVLEIDLDGFEPDRPEGWAVFVEYQLEKRLPEEERLEEILSALRPLLKKGAPASALALVFSLGLGLGIDALLRHLGSPETRARENDTAEILAGFLTRQTSADSLLVHLADPLALPDDLRRALIDAVARPGSRTRLVVDQRSGDKLELGESVACLGPEPVSTQEQEISYKALSARLDELESHRAPAEEFLFLAALCGEHVPADLLFQHLKLDEEGRDTLIDWIDDQLVDGLGLWADHQHQHPSFWGLLVYRFLDPHIAMIVLDQRSEVDREGAAAVLLAFFRDQLPAGIASRGLARTQLALAGHLDHKHREPYLRQLAWWTDPTDAEALGSRIATDLEHGRIPDPEILWTVFQESKRVWSLRRSRALLEAYGAQDDGVPGDRLAAYHYEFAALLRLAGETDGALAAAHRAIQAPTGDDESKLRTRALAWGLAADLAQYERGEPEEALRLRQSEELPLYERLGDIRGVALTHSKIAEILQRRGQLAEALEIYEQKVLRVLEQVGDTLSFTRTLSKVADILQSRGALADALRVQQHVLEVYGHIQAVREKAFTLSRIADLLEAMGEPDRALELREKEELPAYEELGDERSTDDARSKIASLRRRQSS